MQEEWEEEVKIPTKKDAPTAAKPEAEGATAEKPAAEEKKAAKAEAAASQEFEIKKKTKKTTKPFDVETQAHALPPAIMKQFKELENKLIDEDNTILDHKKYKNELESLAYDIKTNIASYGPLENYVDE